MGDRRGGGLELDPGTDGFLFYGATCEDIDFSGMDLAHFGTIGCHFVRCNFTKAVLKDNANMSAWPPTTYEDCRFDRAWMTPGSSKWLFGLGFARFERCTFIKTRMSSWIVLEADFIDCIFEGKMKSAVFNGRSPVREPGPVNADGQFLPGTRQLIFRGNDLSQVDLVGCGLRTGVDVTANRWPVGEDYVWIDDVPTAVLRARTVLPQITDQTAAARASISLERLMSNEQTQTYVRRSELGSHLCTPTAEAIINALSG